MYSRLNGPRCLTWREPGLCMRPFASLFADWPRGSRGCFTGEPKGLKGSDAEHRSPQVYGKGDPDCLTSTLSCLSYLNLWVSKMHKSRFRRSNGCVGSLGTTWYNCRKLSFLNLSSTFPGVIGDSPWIPLCQSGSPWAASGEWQHGMLAMISGAGEPLWDVLSLLPTWGGSTLTMEFQFLNDGL